MWKVYNAPPCVTGAGQNKAPFAQKPAIGRGTAPTRGGRGGYDARMKSTVAAPAPSQSQRGIDPLKVQGQKPSIKMTLKVRWKAERLTVRFVA